MQKPPVTRYLDPAYCLGMRLRDRPRPDWPAAFLIFRDFSVSQRLLALFDEARPVEGRLFYDLGYDGQQQLMYEAQIAGREIIVGASLVWGGPQTAIIIEELASLGVKHILGLGACGSLVGELPQNSLVLCDRALPCDGISRAYGVTEPLTADDGLLRTAQSAVEALGLKAQTVTGAGVDALYRETPALIAGLRDQGAQVVSLEVSAFYAVCAACGVGGLWIGCVSDCLTEETWQHWYIDMREVTDQAGRLCLHLLEGILRG